MFLVGLTGGIGSGKSRSATIFKSLGIPIIDADAIARNIVQPGQPAFCEIRKFFGCEVINETTGEIDRDKLRSKILNNPESRRKLNSITHPRIRKRMLADIIKYFIRGHQFTILEVPLLFETGGLLLNSVHKIISVVCDSDLQLKRLMEIRNLSEQESKQFVEVQMSMKDKAAKSDFVIENSGSLSGLEQQVNDIANKLRESNFHWKVRIILGTLVAISVYGLLLIKSSINFM